MNPTPPMPDASRTLRTPGTPRITRYQQSLAEHRGLQFADYESLWRWSTTDLEGFWSSVWEFFAIESPTPWR